MPLSLCAGYHDKQKHPIEEVYSPSGQRTDEIYHTINLPRRFMYPGVFQGYRQDQSAKAHPRWRSSYSDYGWYSPNVHTVPTVYFPRIGNFTAELSRAGMYRNCSLNTELDKTIF